ncbi:MAG: DUF4031 domain-containing protein [Nocardioidaceae bacterium]
MTILIDPPNAAGHGRLWSHLASDTSFEELHVFARAVGIPERGFDRDHYDVPAEWHDRMVEAGAVAVSSRELIERLVAAGLRRRKSEVLHPRRPGKPLQQPPPVRPGDRVAVVAPAGPVDAGRLGAGIERLRSWGLVVDVPEHLPPAEVPWLAGSDEARASALQQAWLDPEVRVVWCARGGFGSQRVLDLLDWDAMARVGPSWLVGYSDVTALHQAFAARLGVATLHGPGVASLSDAAATTVAAARAAVLEGVFAPLSGEPVVGGSAEGVLVGGNLATLASVVGTRGSRRAAGGIAVLEDVGERPYRIDRLLTQLLRSGWFDEVAGVACGGFTSCGEPDVVREVLGHRLGGLGVPLVLNLPFGHDEVNRTLPLGSIALLHGDSGQLTLNR